ETKCPRLENACGPAAKPQRCRPDAPPPNGEGESPVVWRRHVRSLQDDFRPVFEMHGVVVLPLAAPDEAVLLENPDNLPRDLVLVDIAAVGIRLRPHPIVGMRAGNVDRDPQPVCALAVRARD